MIWNFDFLQEMLLLAHLECVLDLLLYEIWFISASFVSINRTIRLNWKKIKIN